MARTCALAGIDRAAVPMFEALLRKAGAPSLVIVSALDVTSLGKLAPELLVCDIDFSDVDALELLRRIRFVLPGCTIAVYTENSARTWGVACHLAGANCLLSKQSDVDALADGVRAAIGSGCYTDPRFAA
jgi:DNA-binding NarL/FixJ family response regulator